MTFGMNKANSARRVAHTIDSTSVSYVFRSDFLLDFVQNYCALEGIRTPNLLIRSQMLYPLSYKRIWRWVKQTEYYRLPFHAPNRLF